MVFLAQQLVSEMCSRYEEYLDIEPFLFPLDCRRATSPEMRAVKEQLSRVRRRLIQVGGIGEGEQENGNDIHLSVLAELVCISHAHTQLQPRYPRVTELVARRLEMLRGEKPHLKVMEAELSLLFHSDLLLPGFFAL